MKLLIFLCLTSLVFTQQVLNKNACNACTQLKSQNDCTSGRTVPNCEWIASTDTATPTAGKCQTRATVTYQEYCATLTTGCALTNGCAYVDSKCTHFTGCSAYVKTTTAECQAISYECVSDGTACIVANQCSEYKASQTQCETTPSVSGILKCKWDQNTCRDYVCSEADAGLTTDAACNQWLSGCITRGKGCWTFPLPKCSTYTGDATTCASYIGDDGNCELATGATNCQAKVCTNAPQTTITDADCKAFQKGCITSGKGCIQATTLPLCSTYAGDISSCVGYIGSDGVCEGDTGGSQCRSRKCENAPNTYATDTDCGKYKTGCKTTGKGCILTLASCSTYQGTITTCAGYVGQDGYCKGTSTTVGNCAAKVCEEAATTNTTLEACEKYQIGCKSTGAGCVKTLSSCTTYTGDQNSCRSRIGSEGNCTWVSGTNCVARTCAGASTSLSKLSDCQNWFTNCVTNGAGCVTATTCDSTIKELSCTGTTGCAWQPICTSIEGCNQFKSISVCNANKARVLDYNKTEKNADGTDKITPIYKFVSCAWRSGYCYELACSDLTGQYYATDANCSAAKTGCISNKKDACITSTDCSKLTGTMDTCKAYLGAYCTNSKDASATSSCVVRKCSDNTEATDTKACDSWYPGCITNGQGCVDYTTPCTSFSGTQLTCNGLYGYLSGTLTALKINQCYNIESATSSTACVVKTCPLATKMTGESDCTGFLSGCAWNGKDSCVVLDTASCTDYYSGTDGQYCDKVLIKDKTAKYCYGSGASTQCKVRACSDNSTAETQSACDDFMAGCIVKSSKGCAAPSEVLCSSQQGTITTCPDFSGNVSSVKVRCTKFDTCTNRACSDVKTPQSASDCTGFKSSCRFFKANSPCIDATSCASYNVPDTAATDSVKFAYCTSITDSSENSCGFVKGANVCKDRECEQVLSDYNSSVGCTSYLYITVDDVKKEVCKQTATGSYCYKPKSDCTYSIVSTQNTDALKLPYCQLFYNDNGVQCTFKSGEGNCSAQNSCEKVITPTTAKICNDVVGGQNICQKGTNGTGCTTTVATACTSYTLPTGSPTDAQKLAFCQSMKVIDNLANLISGTAVYSSCIWKTNGTTCSSITACSDVPSAVSQADCDAQKSGCYYYSGKCYASASACPSSFPSGVSSSSQKAEYCMANFETTGSTYCQLKDDGTTCVAGSSDTCIIAVPNVQWNGSTITDAAYCQDHSTKDKKTHCIANASSAGNCKAGACEDVPSPTKQGDCDKYVLGCYYLNSKCNTIKKPSAAASECTDTSKVLFGSPISTAAVEQKFAYCNSISKGDGTLFCSYDGSASNCIAAVACGSYTPTVGSELTYCQLRVNTAGKKCSWITGTACSDWDCYDIASPSSQLDCDINGPALKCQYFKGTCVNTEKTCDKIPAVGTTPKEKKTYCEAAPASTECRYVNGNFCVPSGNCETYDVAATAAADRLTTCNALTDGSDKACTFVLKNTVTKCAKKAACTTYAVDANSESTSCPLVKSSDDYPCKPDTAGTGKCVALDCESITTAAECKTNAASCVYQSGQCITINTCGNYSFPGSVNTVESKQSWCETVVDTNGNLCKWDSGASKCADRACSDAKFYTNFDCDAYLKGCKTDGTKCVVKITECTTFSGDSDFCNYLIDKGGKEKCRVVTPATTTVGSCVSRTCYDNVTYDSDQACDAFMTNCVTRGKGCVPWDTPCDQYRGVKDQCEKFKQYISTDVKTNVKTFTYCSGDAKNTETSKCKVRVCSDNTDAKEDSVCKGYLTGCLTNGAGCIDATAPCTSYRGTNADCAKFMGNSQKDYCQGTAADATTVANCRKRLCSDISATSDKGCEEGMKKLTDSKGNLLPQMCVYDGTGCTDNNKSCSQFKGDVDSCAIFTASVNGPCKATTIGSVKGPCTPKICTEAPNTLTTDEDCQNYHPTCYTTGFGCTTSQTCSSLTTSTSCLSRITCTWTNQCKTAITSCSTYSGTSQSQCVNSKVDGKNCAWAESGNTCRAQTCADQPGTIKEHTVCQAFSETCTTSGAGCITMQACSYYTVKSVCLAAATTKDGISRCGWENNVCRARACGDKSATSDKECDDFLSGCKTNGSTCVAAKTCTDFNGNQQYCQKSQKGTCLYVGGICYDYTECLDAQMKTHQACQAFSPLCTTNGTNCIAITSCEKTTLKVSCVVGTNGACGWLPAGGANATEKCQKFGACTDAVGTTNDVCSAYGPSCISDGTACVPISTCSTYRTPQACQNMGTDGVCFMNTVTNSCKLKECGDATANNTTYEGCASFAVASGTCTTDGTKCIPLSTCSSYVEAGCKFGTDGVCIFDLPTGATTGNKSCRVKVCEDIKDGTSNGVCTGISPKKCVSNGKSCIAKAACTTYTTKSACNGGGVDSAGNDVVCTFTVTDPTKPTIGTCKQFSQCSDANNDSAACASKSSACQWKATGTTTGCVPFTCDTITSGTSCQPVPSFDGLSYTVCNLVNGKCTSADPGTITDNNCYTRSAYTYSWNIATSKCESCVAGSTTPTNNTTNTNNTNTTTNDTTTTYGYLLGAMTLGLLGFMA